MSYFLHDRADLPICNVSAIQICSSYSQTSLTLSETALLFFLFTEFLSPPGDIWPPFCLQESHFGAWLVLSFLILDINHISTYPSRVLYNTFPFQFLLVPTNCNFWFLKLLFYPETNFSIPLLFLYLLHWSILQPTNFPYPPFSIQVSIDYNFTSAFGSYSSFIHLVISYFCNDPIYPTCFLLSTLSDTYTHD